MGTLSGLRPPQFSEEDTWLPCWLHEFNGEWLGVESLKEDNVTFEQRIEEFKNINNGTSFRDKGGCNIGELFISGTDSSPFSCAQSTNNVVGFHLCLSSDVDSEDTTLCNDACGAEPNYPIVAQPHGTSEIQKDTNLSTFPDVRAINSTKIAELERHDKKIKQLKLDDSAILSDAVELCIAASEALVINEVIDSDSLDKSSSASAILEASLQLKQARLEVWENTFTDSISVSEMDNLSILDDITMKSVYEDAGIHFPHFSLKELSVSQVKDTLVSEHDELLEHKKTSATARNCDRTMGNVYEDTGIHSPHLHVNELSVSQVKDTLESEHDELLEHKKTDAFARNRNDSVNYNFDNGILLRKDLAAEYNASGAQKKVLHNPFCDLGIDVGDSNDCLRAVNNQANCHPPVSAEEVNTLTSEINACENHVSSSPVMIPQDGEKDYCHPNIVEDRFQSRWLGGWSSNNEVKCAATRCSIPKPFVGQTSFLSESAYTAPDMNSFVQNHDKQAIIVSQVSIHNENFFNRANDDMLLSQEVGCSIESLGDPLCSVVPSSIPENPCSSPILNYRDPILPIINEYKRDDVLGIPSLHNMSAEEANIARRTADNNDSGNAVYRRSTSLREYSMLLPSHTKLSGENNQKLPFLVERNSKLTFKEKIFCSREEAAEVGPELQDPIKENSAQSVSPVVNHSIEVEPHFQASICKPKFSESNLIRTAQPEVVVKHFPCENLQPKLLHCENQSAHRKPAQKRVHFSERETNISDNRNVQKLQTASKPCYSTRAAKKLTRSSVHLESKAQQMDKFLKVHMDRKKKRLIFQNMEFLLTGFSQQKEKEIDGLIRKYGGIVLSQIPSATSKGKRNSGSKSRVLPIVLCLKKTQSFKFLYGCAVNAYVLRVNWLIDSIAAGFVLLPNRYLILPRYISRNDQVYTAVKYNTHSLVFNNLGVILHGKTKYFTNIATILKHGGGQVFKTLQGLIQTLETGRISMAVLVAEEETCASRHLRHCAMEKNIHVTSVYWVIKCLYAGQLVPLVEKGNSRCPTAAIELQRHQESMELSQEI